MAVTADGNRLFITRYISPDDRGEVVEVDTARHGASPGASRLAFDPGPDTESSGRGVPNGLAAAAVSPGRRAAMGRRTQGQHGPRPRTRRSTADFRLDRTLDPGAGGPGEQPGRLGLRYDFNNRDGPVGLQFTPLGDYLFVALEGANAVEVIDADQRAIGERHRASGPCATRHGLYLRRSKLFVDSWLSRSVTVYDVADLVAGSTRQAKRLAEISTVANDPDADDVLAGKRIFYLSRDSRMSRDGYLSCASCHLDERDDGRVWDRTAEGEGLRNTISLAGKGRPDQGLLHWSANFDEIQDFEHDIREAFGGSGFLSDRPVRSRDTQSAAGRP